MSVNRFVAEWINGVLWVHANGRVISINPRGKRRSRNRVVSDVSGDVMAPMPGKVTKVFVQLNDQVSKGQALMVMEAMKMEYTLKSEIDGQVFELNTALGDQVTLGQVLIRMRPKA